MHAKSSRRRVANLRRSQKLLSRRVPLMLDALRFASEVNHNAKEYWLR